MSTAGKIYLKAQVLPEPAQKAVLGIVGQLAVKHSPPSAEPLTLREAAELRGKLAAWENDWDALGMEAYDRP